MSDGVREAVEALLGSRDVHDSAGAWSQERGLHLFGRLLDDAWHLVGLAEDLGGQGGELTDAVEVVAATARAGVPLPMAETNLVVPALLAAARLSLPADVRCAVVALPSAGAALAKDGAGWTITARALRVPWARWASHVLLPFDAAKGEIVALVELSSAVVQAGSNLLGEPRDDVLLHAMPVRKLVELDGPAGRARHQAEFMGALSRSVQMSGALDAMVSLTAGYVNERRQFGRPLSAFQAVQQQLAELAAEAAAAAAAVQEAVRVTASHGDMEWAIACAKVRVGMAAGTGARISHQLHGAIGVTQEYTLQRYTRALWSWREEFGSERVWSRRIAAELAASSSLWGRVTR